MIWRLIGHIFFGLFRFWVRGRYRIKFEGLDELKKMGGGGFLFLPNHPAHIDALILASYLWPKFKVRPMIVEYTYYGSVMHWFLKKVLRSIPVPAFERSSNTYKLMRAERAGQRVVEGLKKKENYIVYPAGRLMRTASEQVGGSSLAHDIVQKTPEAKVVLVRTRGLWGSRFGWGLKGKRPSLPGGLWANTKMMVKNGFFFTPRRRLTITFELASEELKAKEDRLEFNRTLESWYNDPAPEPITLISMSCWKPKFPKLVYKSPMRHVSIDEVSMEVRRKVIAEVARLSGKKASDIRPGMHLYADLGFDSLDIAELRAAVEKTSGVASDEEGWTFDLLTVGTMMVMAAGLYEEEGVVYATEPPKGWIEEGPRLPPQGPDGETLLEAFFIAADRNKDRVACADERSGVRTYQKLKERVLLLARKIRAFPGKRVGVLLPSCVAVEVVILACWMAGKVPVMINWTIGSRYLKTVNELGEIEVVISSWKFLNRLDGADLTPIQEKILTLEALAVQFSAWDLICAKRQAKKTIDVTHIKPDDEAVLLFTSGTEAAPKAVPLSHRNILANQREAMALVQFSADDCLYSILPPFHSLGFNVTGLWPLLVGGKVIYSADPTNGRKLAREIALYRPTLICSAPTFLQGMFEAAEPGQLNSLRLIVSGAEKASPDLFEQARKVGAELAEGYGITECAPILTMNPPGEPARGVGKPLPGVDLLIVHPESHEKLAQGETGLILARGPNVFDGYLGKAPANPFLEIDGQRWYVTGDLGQLDEVGSLHLAGRLKRFVKIGGEMISLPALESALLEAAMHNQWGNGKADRQLAVIAVGEHEGRPDLVLFANIALDLEEVNRVLREMGFSNLSRISAFEHLHELPKMGTGKIDYRGLETLVPTC